MSDVLALLALFAVTLAACWFADWVQQPGGRRTVYGAWAAVCHWRRRHHSFKAMIWGDRFVEAQERSLPAYPPTPGPREGSHG